MVDDDRESFWHLAKIPELESGKKKKNGYANFFFLLLLQEILGGVANDQTISLIMPERIWDMALALWLARKTRCLIDLGSYPVMWFYESGISN